MTPQPRKRINYLNNADMLRELHKSKMSFCSRHDEQYFYYDVITDSVNKITPELLEAGRQQQLKRLITDVLREVQKKRNCTPKQALAHIERTHTLPVLEDISIEQVVVRVMTDEHIPYAEEEDGKDAKLKTNFKPFKHVVLREHGVLEEVVWSHWQGSISTGKFCTTHGKVTEELARMFIKLTDKIGTKGCYRNYSFLDEMKSSARFQLVRNALLFDESRVTAQLNPFAYYTTCVYHEFVAVLNEEKKRRNLRDDLLEDYGFDPSVTRQVEIEQKMMEDFTTRKQPVKAAPIADGGSDYISYDD